MEQNQGNIWQQLPPDQFADLWLEDLAYVKPKRVGEQKLYAIHTADDGLRITLAVAGFTLDDLEILLEDNQLNISGHQAEEDQRVYLHRGIATRQFKRSFVIAEGVEVTAAVLDNGLLHIDLRQPTPQRNARTIEISPASGGAESKTIDVSAEDA